MKKLSLVLALFLLLPILAVATVDDSDVTAKGTATVENAEPQEPFEPPATCELVSKDSSAGLISTERLFNELLAATEVAFVCTRCGCEPGCCLNREGTLCLRSGQICRECLDPAPGMAVPQVGGRSVKG